MRKVCLRSLWLALCVAGVANADVATQAVQAMPFDLAFSRVVLGHGERPSISPDGKQVAYTVHTPPAMAPSKARYLPNGVPANVPGNAILVTTLAGRGPARAIGPRGASCWRPAFSPDGTRLAFYCDAGGVPHLWVHDLVGDRSHQLGDAPIKPMLWAGDEPQWSPDGSQIWVPLAPAIAATSSAAASVEAESPRVRVHTAVGEQLGGKAPGDDGRDVTAILMRENNAALAAIDAASGSTRIVVAADSDPPPNVSQLSRSGRWVAYLTVFRLAAGERMAMSHDLVVVPAKGGTARVVARDLPVTENDYYLDAYSWHVTRDQLFWIKDGRLWTVDLSDAAIEPRQLRPELTDLTRQPLTVTADGSAVIVGARPLDMRDYRDPYPQALAVVPLAGGTPRMIELPAGLVFQEALTQRQSVAWQPRADVILVLARKSVTAENVVVELNVRSGRARTVWTGLAELRPAGASADHRTFIASFEDLNTPVDLHAFDRAFRRRPVTRIEARLAQLRFGPTATFETVVPQFDGSTTKVTTAVLLPPGGKRGDRLPTLVFLYPGDRISGFARRFGGGSPSTVPVSLFTTRGYAVLLAELPIGQYGKPGRPVSEMVDVLLPQVHRAAELGYADIARVAVGGQSYGGYGTAAVITGTKLFRAAIAIDGGYDLAGLYGWMDSEIGDVLARWAEAGQGRMGTHPWADRERYLDNSPYYRADRIRTPLLLLHGQADHVFPVEDARKMFNALERLGRTVQLAEYVGDGHSMTDWSVSGASDAGRRMVDFLDKYLRPTLTPQ